MRQKTVMFETSSLINIANGILRCEAEIMMLVERLKKLVRQDQIKVVYTHIQVDEIRKEEERKAILELLNELEAELIPTRVGVVGVSKVGAFGPAGKLEQKLYEKLRAPESKDGWWKDLIQALTGGEVDMMVTDDNGVIHAIREIKKETKERLRCQAYHLDEFSKIIKQFSTNWL